MVLAVRLVDQYVQPRLMPLKRLDSKEEAPLLQRLLFVTG